MGTSAFIRYRYNGDVKGFIKSADGMHEQAGVDILTKYKELTNEELITFLTKRLTFSEPIDEDDATEERLEAPYTIWSLDWKKDSMEVEDGSDNVNYEGSVTSGEYGYVFNLDNDAVELYEQPEYDDELNRLSDDILTHVVTRENATELITLFQTDTRPEIEWTEEEIKKRLNQFRN